jgi:diguanylate cyclase
MDSTETSKKCELHAERMRNRLVDILNKFEPLVEEEKGRHHSILHSLSQSKSMDNLILQTVDIIRHIGIVVDSVRARFSHADAILTGLGEDLAKIENNLTSYHSHNKEIYSVNNKFNDKLISEAEGINHIFTETKGLEDIRKLIISKLSWMVKSIEEKKQTDEEKLRIAEKMISELQISLRAYGDEIVQMKERASALEKEVMLDQLTGILNRRAYELQIRESLRRYNRDGESFGLLLMDVDNFKNINDTFGHIAGDKCLMEIAKGIRRCLRKADFLARYGGDEIVAILPGAGVEDSKNVADKIRKSIERTVFWNNEVRFSITISAGVTTVNADDQEPGDLFSRVDFALYETKKKGRNRIRVL